MLQLSKSPTKTIKMKFLGRSEIVALIVIVGLASPLFAVPWEPEREPNQQRHQELKETSARERDRIKVVFLGSSLVEFWGREGLSVWNEHFAPRDAFNYGIGGDRTEHVLWRIANGELDGLNPKLVVLYIGSNNVPMNPNNDEIVRGVNTVVDKLHEKLPNANILLVGTFPRADVQPVRNTLLRIRDIDDKLINLVDGDGRRKSHFLDLFWHLAPESMDRIYTELYVSDNLHFNVNGYSMWQREMNDIFNRLTQ